MNRRTFVGYLGLVGAGALLEATGNQAIISPNRPSIAAQQRLPLDDTLRIRAMRKGLFYGAAAQYRHLRRDVAFSTQFGAECGLLVPENELKWRVLRPAHDQYDFSRSDWLVSYAERHGMLFRGTTLVWHHGLPEWFASGVDRATAASTLRNHISNVVGRYAGKVHSWDVVNEAVHPEGGRADGLRESRWLKLLGPQYIDMAFRFAAEADPGAMLVYNERNLDYDVPSHERQRYEVLRLLERMVSRGVPIDALGIQGHLRGHEWRFQPRVMRNFLAEVRNLGLKVLITEFDVRDRYLPGRIGPRDKLIAERYREYMVVVLNEPSVIGVVTWGLSDRYSWLASRAPRMDGAPVRPLPLDESLKRKPAWRALADTFDAAPTRPS